MELAQRKNTHLSQNGVDDWNSDDLCHQNEPQESNVSQRPTADTLSENIISYFSYLENHGDSVEMRESDLLPYILSNEPHAENLSQYAVAHSTSDDAIPQNTNFVNHRDSYEIGSKNFSLDTDGKTKNENTVFSIETQNGNLTHPAIAHMTPNLIHLSTNSVNRCEFYKTANNNSPFDTNENLTEDLVLRNESHTGNLSQNLVARKSSENIICQNTCLENESLSLLTDAKTGTKNSVFPNEPHDGNITPHAVAHITNDLIHLSTNLENLGEFNEADSDNLFHTANAKINNENAAHLNELRNENREYRNLENVIPLNPYSEYSCDAYQLGSDNLFQNMDVQTANEKSILPNVSHDGNPLRCTIAQIPFENIVTLPGANIPDDSSYTEMYNLSQYTELKKNYETLVPLNKRNGEDLSQLNTTSKYVFPSHTYLENYCDSYEIENINLSRENASSKTGDTVVLYEWHCDDSPNQPVLLASSENSDPLSIYSNNVCNSYEMENCNLPQRILSHTTSENLLPLSTYLGNQSDSYQMEKGNSHAGKDIDNLSNSCVENLFHSMPSDLISNRTYSENDRDADDYALKDYTYCDLAPSIREVQKSNILRGTEAPATSKNSIFLNTSQERKSRRMIIDLTDLIPVSQSTCSKNQREHIRKDHKDCEHYVRKSLCYICGKVLLCEGERYFKKHLLTHFEFRPVICDVCDYACRDKRTLINHYRLHKNRKNIKCDMCDKKFRTRECLKAHIRRYHADRKKKFKCRSCDKSYYDRTSLNHHRNCAHINKNSYVCDLCGARFTFLDTLRNHIDGKHIKFPLYKCKSCDKSFHTKPSLRQHMVSHVKKRTFDCGYPFCKKVFKSKPQLADHIVTHMGLKPYKCNTCSNYYVHRGSLRNHKKKCSEM